MATEQAASIGIILEIMVGISVSLKTADISAIEQRMKAINVFLLAIIVFLRIIGRNAKINNPTIRGTYRNVLFAFVPNKSVSVEVKNNTQSGHKGTFLLL